MPRRPTARPADAASLRALQQRLPELSVPTLLRVRDATDGLLQRPRLRLVDVAAVVAAAAPEAP
ncbi:MAG: hypothetical protein ACYDAC_07955 [Candidatus Dormibacteria bacterium]